MAVVPSGSEVVVMVNGGGDAMVMAKDCVAVCDGIAESCTCTAKGVGVPGGVGVVGVPEICPVVELKLRLTGKGPVPETILHVSGGTPPEESEGDPL